MASGRAEASSIESLQAHLSANINFADMGARRLQGLVHFEELNKQSFARRFEQITQLVGFSITELRAEIEALSLTCRSEQSRVPTSEASLCCKAGAYRAAKEASRLLQGCSMSARSTKQNGSTHSRKPLDLGKSNTGIDWSKASAHG